MISPFVTATEKQTIMLFASLMHSTIVTWPDPLSHSASLLAIQAPVLKCSVQKTVWPHKTNFCCCVDDSGRYFAPNNEVQLNKVLAK